MNSTTTLRAWCDRKYDIKKPTNVQRNADGSIAAVIRAKSITFPSFSSFEMSQTRPSDEELLQGAFIVCDNCSRRIAKGDAFYSCHDCLDYDFDLCAECFTSGKHKHDSSHKIDRVVWP